MNSPGSNLAGHAQIESTNGTGDWWDQKRHNQTFKHSKNICYLL